MAVATPLRHAWLTTKTRRRRRYECTECGRTVTATAGTPYHRWRHRCETFDRVIAMSMEGTTKSAIARVAGISPQTVTRWVERGAAHAECFRGLAIQDVEPVEVQVDELCRRQSVAWLGSTRPAQGAGAGRVTQAMQAGLATQPLTLRDIFLAQSQAKWSWAGPRQVGRKSPRWGAPLMEGRSPACGAKSPLDNIGAWIASPCAQAKQPVASSARAGDRVSTGGACEDISHPMCR